MHIIKLNAIGSTNTFLKQKYALERLEDYTVVVAEKQTNGKGQMNTVWNSEAKKNLTTSVFKDVSWLAINLQFYVSIVTCLALLKTLKSFSVSNLAIKWPNDILADNKKICGVLIENSIKENQIKASIIGIGLNVNQTEFNDLPNASSLKNCTGKDFDLNELTITILTNMKHYFSYLEKGDLEFLKNEYEANLFRKDKPTTFKDVNKNTFMGYIKGITNSGKLQVLVNDKGLIDFSLKEIQLIY